MSEGDLSFNKLHYLIWPGPFQSAIIMFTPIWFSNSDTWFILMLQRWDKLKKIYITWIVLITLRGQRKNVKKL